MAKAKFADKAEAKTALSAAKEERKAAKEELRAFEKEHGLAKGEDHAGDEKNGKKWAKLKKVVDSKDEAVNDIEESMKELKSEKTIRPSKYEYPADVVTAADKKKWRAKQRTAAKKKDKGDEETAAPAEKKEKKNGNGNGEKKEKKKEKVSQED
jgi:hypothetical protein